MTTAMIRVSVEPLVEECGGLRSLARWAGTNATKVRRWRTTGITVDDADRIAVSLGRHPVELWPNWYELPVVWAEAA